MASAQGHAVGVGQFAVEEHGDGRGAAAHVDMGHAQVFLVLDQAGEGRGVGRDHLGLDIQVTAGDGRLQGAHGAGAGADDMHVHAQALAKHAARVAHAAVAVDAVPHGDGVDDHVVRRLPAQQAPGVEDAAHVGVSDLVPGDGNLIGDEPGFRSPARHIDDHPADVLSGHVLGRFHGRPDGCLGGVHADDGAAAQPAGHLVPDADHPQRPFTIGAGDEAAHLRGAHVQGRDQAAANLRLRRAFFHAHRLSCLLLSFRVRFPGAGPRPSVPATGICEGSGGRAGVNPGP